MSTFENPRPDSGELLETMVSRLLQGESLAAFSDWFASPDGPLATVAPRTDPLGARAMARALWAAVPLPQNRWRPRGLPKLERNDPCYCGSGRKYKHCCAAWADLPLPIEPEMLMALAIQHAPPQALDLGNLRTLPPHALAQAAMFWMEQGRPEQVERVLAPLFEQAEGLDERHEPAFDILMDALQALGQQTRRLALARRIGQSRDKALAVAALGREVSMLADQGDYRGAWAVFKQAQRAAPDDPQLWHLELVTLLAEGRADEARLRGPLLAAKARRGGFDELALVLQDLAEHGLQAAYEHMAEGAGGFDAENTRDWLALCAQVPDTLDADAVRAAYRIETQGTARRTARPQADAAKALTAGMRWLRVRPARALAALERRWQRRFPVDKPMSTQLLGDAEALIEDAFWAAEFLRLSPEGWMSVQVLDDLLLAAQERVRMDESAADLQAAWRLAEHALRLLHALWHTVPDAASARQARLGAEWAHAGTQPLLRLLAQVIDLGHACQRDVLALAEWGLALNPVDNHGWRAQVTDAYIAQGRAADALALLDQYPNDWPPAQHRRALALYVLGRPDEAAAVLAQAHAEYPAFMQALWPDMLDVPEAEQGPGMRVGGSLAAYDYRVETRADWVRTGALAWARSLALPVKPARKTSAATRKRAAPKGAAGMSNLLAGGTGAHDLALPESARQHLRRHSDWPRLHGFLAALAWAPDLVMPGRWLPGVLDWRTNALPKTQAAQLKAINADVDAIMRLYNSLNAPLANAQAGMAMPLPAPALAQALGTEEGGAVTDEAWHTWAAGFVQGAELSAAGWRRLGHPLQAKPSRRAGAASTSASAFMVLHALAARAPRAVAGDEPAWQPMQDDGQPLLLGLDDTPQTVPPADQIQGALNLLWPSVLAARLARQSAFGGAAIQFDSFSLD